jgi:uncharacterized membrane-anchored protein
MSNRWIWLALALPLACIVLAVARAELFVQRAQELSLPIQGYDPRDLLQGHYLQFRLAVSTAHGAEACASGECCLCLMRVQGQLPADTSVSTCREARGACSAALPLSAAERSWRFYVPESQARELEQALRAAHAEGRAYAVLAIERSGEARVRELRLAGKRYGSGLGAR